MVASPPVPARGAAPRQAGNAPQRQAAEVADRLHSAAIHLLRRLRKTDPLTGISAAQLSVLSVLLSGPRTIGTLAAAEQVKPPTISRVVRQLEADGLVTRERDAADQRVVWIGSTEAGQQVLAHGRELRVGALAHAIEQLSTHEQQALIAGLQVLDSLLQSL
jgi:DNA-binding MarR family transcriptional regulator